MKKKLLLVCVIALAAVVMSGCTKRCRCVKYDTSSEYYTQEELSALGKTCTEMRYMEGLSTQRYSICEWVYGE